MKEQHIINKVRLLKSVHPAKPVLQDIKQGVYQQVRAPHAKQASFGIQEWLGNMVAVIRAHTIAYYGVAFAMLLIVFVSVASIVFPNQFYTAMLYGRLTFAPNQYQKARIALADTKNRFASSNTDTNTQELSQSLALTNTQLDSLKLKGESGKYTAQDCHRIYQEYRTYLEEKEKVLAASKNPSLAPVKSQINSYEEQAEIKLHMYTSL